MTSQTTLDVNDLLIRALPTPNPMALKFVLNITLKTEGKATLNSPLECENQPLLRDLFAIDGVRQVHVFQNTLTVTHSGELDNEQVSDQVSAVMRARFNVHNPDFGEPAKPLRVKHTSENPQIQVIEEILDRTVRPGLQADGGDIEVLGFENNELKIVYQGACGGCPSAMMGTLDAIQGILRSELNNESITVQPV